MKKIYIALFAIALLFIAQSCEKDLPYPIKDVTRGVVIDIVRIPGTDGVLSDGITTGNCKIKVTIPENQGDYSFMSHAQILAVLEGADKKMTSHVVVDNITEFPKEIQLLNVF